MRLEKKADTLTILEVQYLSFSTRCLLILSECHNVIFIMLIVATKIAQCCTIEVNNSSHLHRNPVKYQASIDQSRGQL